MSAATCTSGSHTRPAIYRYTRILHTCTHKCKCCKFITVHYFKGTLSWELWFLVLFHRSTPVWASDENLEIFLIQCIVASTPRYSQSKYFLNSGLRLIRSDSSKYFFNYLNCFIGNSWCKSLTVNLVAYSPYKTQRSPQNVHHTANLSCSSRWKGYIWRLPCRRFMSPTPFWVQTKSRISPTAYRCSYICGGVVLIFMTVSSTPRSLTFRVARTAAVLFQMFIMSSHWEIS
jgi:hypothetical protein